MGMAGWGRVMGRGWLGRVRRSNRKG